MTSDVSRNSLKRCDLTVWRLSLSTGSKNTPAPRTVISTAPGRTKYSIARTQSCQNTSANYWDSPAQWSSVCSLITFKDEELDWHTEHQTGVIISVRILFLFHCAFIQFLTIQLMYSISILILSMIYCNLLNHNIQYVSRYDVYHYIRNITSKLMSKLCETLSKMC